MSTLRHGNLKLAILTLKQTKARSFLTMLGIVIGIMSVICVVCVGQGIKSQIVRQVSHFGQGAVIIRPASLPLSGSSELFNGDALPSTSSILTPKDLQVARQTPGVAYAVPLSVTSGTISADHTVKSPIIIATSRELADAINQPLRAGGFFDPGSDVHEVVLGQDIAHKLFNDDLPLGEKLTWRGQSFMVAGVFNGFSSAPFSLSASFNDAIFVPYDTASSLAGGSLAIYQIIAHAKDPAKVSDVVNALQQQFKNVNGGALPVNVVSANNDTSSSNRTVHLLTLLIMAVAGIALIVGGVGIMDVLLVSVTERMHEIGIRKAIGATNRQIMNQFLAEALVLSGMGALIGTVLSLCAIGLLRLFTTWQPVLIWQVFIIAPVVAIAIGVIFGTAPALKAARKDPIDALRHE